MKLSSSNRQEKQTYRTVDTVVKRRLLPDFMVKVFREINNMIENFNREHETI